MQKIFFSVAAVFRLISSLAFVSCRLAGIWDDDDFTMELFSDGTGVLRFGGEQESIIWIAENNRLILLFSMWGTAETEVWDYVLSGNTLSLTDQDGETSVVRRRRSGKLRGARAVFLRN